MADGKKEDEIYGAIERRQGWAGVVEESADCEAGIFHIERGPGGEIKNIRRLDESARARRLRKLAAGGRRLVAWIYSKIRSRDR